MFIDNQTHRLSKWYPFFDFFIFFLFKLSSITDLYGIEDEFLLTTLMIIFSLTSI